MAEENTNPQASYYDGWDLSDESKGFLQTLGYKDAQALVDGLKNTRSYVGVDKNDLIRIPKADPEGNRDLSEVFKALGKPEKAEDYNLGDTDFGKAAAQKLFDLGITAKQAEALAAFMGEQNASIEKSNTDSWNESVDKGIAELKKEWGADFTSNTAIAQETVRDLVSKTGFTEKELDAIEKALGTAQATKLFYTINQMSGGVKNLSGYQSTTETPEIAKFKIQELKSDPEFVKRMAARDPKAIREMNRLTALSFGENK